MNEKVLVSKDLLDELANKFKHLTGENKKFTIQEMINTEIPTVENYANNELETFSSFKMTKIKERLFYQCTNLKTAYFEKVEYIGNEAFAESGLQDLYLGYDGVVELESANVFDLIIGENPFVIIHVKSQYKSLYDYGNYWNELIRINNVVIVGDYEEVMSNE